LLDVKRDLDAFPEIANVGAGLCRPCDAGGFFKSSADVFIFSEDYSAATEE
jgi:hypothetical protein